MERNLAMEVVRVTEAAALAAARLMGRGDNIAADQAAVTAMRKALSFVQFKGRVVIGEGERDEAPMLYIGEEVGAAETPKVDIAVDPLEGTNIVSAGGYNAIAVIAIAEEGGFLHAPDTYMQKLAVGPKARGVIDITATPTENLRRIAKAQKAYVEDLCVVILDRPRHQDLIREVREAGARIKLIGDGDVAGAIATSKEGSGVDVLMGTGGAPEGVLAAAALKCMGGDFQGVLKFRNKEEIDRAKVMGVTDLNRVYALNDLASSDVMFAATGVTFGDFLKGVRFFSGGAYTQSVVMRSRSRTTRVIDTTHYFEFKPKYEYRSTKEDNVTATGGSRSISSGARRANFAFPPARRGASGWGRPSTGKGTGPPSSSVPTTARGVRSARRRAPTRASWYGDEYPGAASGEADPHQGK